MLAAVVAQEQCRHLPFSSSWSLGRPVAAGSHPVGTLHLCGAHPFEACVPTVAEEFVLCQQSSVGRAGLAAAQP